MRKKLCGLLLAVLLFTACLAGNASMVYAKTALNITKQPVSVTVLSGSTAKVSFTVTGEGLTYKWYYKNAGDKKFTRTTTFKGRSYSVEMNKSRNGRQVYCKVTDKYGKSVKTNTVTLRMSTSIKITKQPTSVVAPKGSTAKVSFSATGKELTYKWYYKNAGDKKFTRTTTFKGTSYSAEMSKSRNGRQVYCKITDKYGTSVKTNTVTLHMGTPLKITKQPVAGVAKSGSTAKVTFSVSGDGLTYKWYYKDAGSRKFTVTTAFKGRSYAVKMNKSRNGRQVYCKVTDKYGKSVKTDTVTLHIGTPLKITKQPVSVAVCNGVTAKTTLSATGDGLTYKWYYKNPGSSKFARTTTFKGRSYSVKMTNSRDGRQIYCVVTDKYGVSVKTKTVTLSVTHTYDSGVVTKKATCSHPGEKVYTCQDCSRKVVEALPKTAHKMGDWKVIREATAAAKGLERCSCRTCSYYTERSLAKLPAVYYITVDTGVGKSTKVGVAANGQYKLDNPTRVGYVFKGWEDTSGNAFSSQGTIKANIAVKALWDVAGTDTLAKLIQRANAGVDRILITGNITVDKPIYISYGTTVYADGDYTLMRAPGYAGDIFVVGQDSSNTPAIQLHRKAVLTLGGGKGTLTIDGNRDNLKVTVVGSAVYVSDSATLNLYDGVKIANHHKLGNERVLTNTEFVSEYTSGKAGGAAVLNLNATVNMYGGIMENNAVATEYTIINHDDGTQEWLTNNACGGAVYNRGNFNMYGGTITGSEALRGGGVYSDFISYLHAGTISNNLAHAYGGGLSTSSSASADIYVGTEGNSSAKMVFSGNYCKGPGGAMYSNTSSPIIVLGNAVFDNNVSDTSGGAIYTAGPLTVRNARFTENSSIGSGGAVYHYYTKAEFERRHLTLENCSFESNKSNLGGAVILSASNTVAGTGTVATITGCTFQGNRAVLKDTATGNGGAIYVTRQSEATITDCTFTGNTATGNAGAVAAQGGTKVSLTGGLFADNSALQGGALYASGAASLQLTDVPFVGNDAVVNEKGGAGLGGAMFIDNTPVTTKNIDLLDNAAGVHGGAVYLKAVTMTLDADSQVTGNSAAQHGGAFYLTYQTNSDSTKTGAVLNATGANFNGNTAMAGGAVSARTDCAVNLDGVKLTNNHVAGYLDKNDGDGEGGGAIYVGYGSATLKNVTATGNAASDFGGVVDAAGATITVTGGTFTDNKTNSGGVIYARNGSTVSVTDATMNENESVYVQGESYDSNIGGGAINVASGTLTVKDSTLDGNKSGYYGGAILSNKSTVTISDNTTVSNSVGATGAALYFKAGSTVTITDTRITDNISNGNGVVYQNAGTLDMTQVTATGNKASQGGVLFTSGASTQVTLRDSAWNSNTANSNGGAVFMENASVTILNSELKDNTAKNGGAAYNRKGTLVTTDSLYSGNSATSGSGGAICMAGGTVNVTGNSQFTGNSATNHAGGIYVSYFNNEDKTKVPAVLTANGATFDSNTAMGGGAVSIRTDCEATLENTTLTNNSVTGNDGKADGYGEGGGAVYVGYGELTLDKVTATGNTSSTYGGAVQVIESPVTITDGSYTKNMGGTGGAVYVSTGSTATIKDITFTENSATSHGGALYLSDAAVTASNLDFSKNTATSNGGALYLNAIELTVDSEWTFAENTAGGHGGAIYLTYKTNADQSKTGAVLNATDVTFEGNTAMAGGALSARTACTINLNGTKLVNNSVTGYVDDGNEETTDDNNGDGEGGGAIYVGYGQLNMTDVTATGNTASDFGGVVDAVASPVTITGGTFSGNEANSGGVIHAMTGSTITITDATLKENKAPSVNTEYNTSIGGGAIHTVGGKLNISGTTLDGNSSGNYAGTVHASGTTVKINGNSVLTKSSGATGAGLYFRGSCAVTLENISVIDNTSSSNGIIYQSGGTLTMDNVTATGNKAVSGGVLYTSGGAKVTLSNSTWSGNTATSSGGTIYAKGATVNLVNSTLKENNAKYGGAASVYDGGTLNLTGVTFKDNVATSDGGAIFNKGGNVIGADTADSVNTFTGNTAAGSGGAIDVVIYTDEATQATKGGVLSLTGGTFTDNKGGTGGAIAVYTDGSATIQGATFHSNEATYGGAVYVDTGSTIDLADLTFTENSASSNAGALYVNDAAFTASNLDFSKNTAGGNAGALYLNAVELTVDSDWTFTENTAGGHGGAIYLTYKTNADKSKIGAVLNATDVTFEGNTAMAGGAISVRTACTVNLDGTTLTGNSVSGYADNNDGDGEGGGAIYVGYGTATLKNVTATGNTASDFGGVVDATGATVTINGGTYTGNKTNNGGVIYARSNSNVTITDATMSGNESVYVQSGTFISGIGGGAIYTVGGKLTITGTTLDGNKSGYYGGTIQTNGTTVVINGNSVITNSSGATGAACYFMNNSTVTMENMSVTDNVSSANGVLYILGTMSLDNVSATGNKAVNGGVLYASGSSTQATVKNCTWSGNTATNEGGAIYLKDGATVNLIDSTMKENTGKFGGVVNAYNGAKLNLSGMTFQDNEATSDGGAIYTKAATVTTTDTADSTNTFTDNTAANHGGAIYVTYLREEGKEDVSGVLNMTGGLLENNVALAGGAISARTSCQVYLTNTVLKGNTATIASTGNDKAGGGALYTNDGTLTLSGVTLEGNTSGYYGGAIYALNSVVAATDDCLVKSNEAITGTALWLTIKANTTVTLEDLILTDNIRTGGSSNGTIYATGSGTLDITNLVASGNTSSNGGILYASGNLTTTIKDSTLTGNTAVSMGGVIAYRGSKTLTITNTTMSGNTAPNGGAIEASGSGKVIIKSSKLEENTASKSGGAIYATGAGKVEVSDGTTIKSNEAPTGGAVFVDTGASVTINGITIEDNKATGGDGGAIVVADTTKTDTSTIGTAATTLTMSGVTLKNNTASSKGGALATDMESPNLVINATDCTFIGNKTTGAGGGAVEIQNGNCNSATDPTVVPLVFKDCTFIGNTAKSTGGAIEIRTNSCAKIDGITATDNVSNNGGAIYVTSNYSRLYLTGTVTQSGNTARESGGAPFIGLYNNNYSNPPKIYTTHTSTADWYSGVGGNRTSIVFDLTILP